MNTQLTQERHSTRSDTTAPQLELAVRPARRVGLLDRAAMHLGVALIRWGRRPGPELARHERRANRLELAVLTREYRIAEGNLERERAQAMQAALISRIR